jgi:hypothetical protein
MKCDECAPLLEDYLCNEVDGATEKALAEHLHACDSCAREYELLRREQELYARSEVEIAPDFWSGVQARIATENRSRAQGFAGLFNAFRFAPVAAIACLLVVVGSVGLWRYFSPRTDRPMTAQIQNAPQVGVTTTTEKSLPQIETVKSDAVRPIRLVSPSSSRADARKTVKSVPSTNEVVENKPLSNDLDADSARHLEQVEMLLRSFKNGRHSNTLDLTYESGLSKDLLARNVLLRRDAELSGDEPLTRLLDQFEPFLVDIANLRDNSDAKEIHNVRERLAKSEIIAAVHSF